ncbi:MAG: radical SAM protein [Proteobacteria bacterium]|nr:radical SAM protein [Pseudomonadota bacterium]MBU1738208.1 radical SAM protein [Pseudomonadota bacterium]
MNLSNTISQQQKFLFLNPPAPEIVIRDYYCSKSSRSNYLFPPIDFVLQSGVLANDYQLFFIDSVCDHLTVAETSAQIDALNPDVIFFLAGAVNHPADLQFIANLARTDRILIGSGDLFLSSPTKWLQDHPYIDALLLDFTTRDLQYYLRRQYHKIERMAYRSQTGEIIEVNAPGELSAIEVDIPQHRLFMRPGYRFPFARSPDFAVFLTDFGCPFQCTFCVMAALPHRSRPNREALAELHSLHEMGIRELFWMNQTFAVHKKSALELLHEMQGFSPLFGWTAFCRPDLLDEQLLVQMKKAGCHTMIIGVENGSDEILQRYKKGYTLRDITAAFTLCRKHGIQTVGTFILGLPGETEATIRATSRLACDLDCDYASFHVAVPRAATQMRQDAIDDGRIAPDHMTMDQSGKHITFAPEGIPPQRLVVLKRQAVLGFYLRPRFLARKLLRRRSLYEWKNILYQGFSLLWNNTFDKGKLWGK